MEVIEQERIRRRFSQAVNTYDDHAEAQKRICAHLVQLLAAYTSSHFRRVLEIGCGSGGFTRLLKQECQIEEWVLNDLCETWQSAIEELFPSAPPLFLAGQPSRDQGTDRRRAHLAYRRTIKGVVIRRLPDRP